jgi:YebC/PmpR family DNA-binding regulatory protein
MSGHSKWSTIKHKKGAADAKRGKKFSKLAKHIMVAARNGGGNPADNLTLRYAIEKARAEFMPKDSILRAVKKGTGELEGGELEELSYEGIGPSGISFILEILTDNRNRTASEVRNLIDKRGGSLGKTGSVTWKFDHRGVLELSSETMPEDEIFEIVTEAGAEDLTTEGDVFQVTTTVENLEAVRAAIQAAVDAKNPKTEKAWGDSDDEAPLFSRHEITWIPQNTLPLDGKRAESAIGFLEVLEEHDDVQNLYCDLEVPEERAEGGE